MVRMRMTAMRAARPKYDPAKYDEPGPKAFSPEVKVEVDQILEAIIYFTTETRRITKELAKRVNLTGPQLTVVKILETIGDLSLSELSDKIRSQNSTVTGIIDRMEREGLVQRVRSHEDRRVIRIHLTEKGAKLARDIPVEPMEVLRGALSGLTPQETKDFLRIMTKIAKRIRATVHKSLDASETPLVSPARVQRREK
jgi:MarR family transcriptional regulator, organic hydroperoxide resistance regulator